MHCSRIGNGAWAVGAALNSYQSRNRMKRIRLRNVDNIYVEVDSMLSHMASVNKFSVDLWTRVKNYYYQLKELPKMKGINRVTIADFEFFMEKKYFCIKNYAIYWLVE
jgi:hypothetical protein